MTALHEALSALSEALTAAAAAKEVLARKARDTEWACVDDELGAAVMNERGAALRLHAAYRGAIVAALNDPLEESWIGDRLIPSLRAERRYVLRLDSKVLAQLARAYRDLAADAEAHARDEEGSAS